MNYVLFTDGASKGNPGPGGWGCIVVGNGTVRELGGGERNTTNNRMELSAAIAGLKAVGEAAEPVVVYADSKYVIEGITKWVFSWRKNGWVTSLKKPVLNEDLWKELLAAAEQFGGRLVWKYVGGHVGIPGNERADAIASSFAEGRPVELYRGPLGSYPVDVRNLESNGESAKLKSRSNGKAYSYVSEVAGVVRVHQTWAECEACVRGQKARYRKALNAEEERELREQFGGKQAGGSADL